MTLTTLPGDGPTPEHSAHAHGGLPPFAPGDFDTPCEDCGAPAGSYCRPSCDSGYSAVDAAADAARLVRSGRR